MRLLNLFINVKQDFMDILNAVSDIVSGYEILAIDKMTGGGRDAAVRK